MPELRTGRQGYSSLRPERTGWSFTGSSAPSSRTSRSLTSSSRASMRASRASSRVSTRPIRSPKRFSIPPISVASAIVAPITAEIAARVCFQPVAITECMADCGATLCRRASPNRLGTRLERRACGTGHSSAPHLKELAGHQALRPGSRTGCQHVTLSRHSGLLICESAELGCSGIRCWSDAGIGERFAVGRMTHRLDKAPVGRMQYSGSRAQIQH